MILRIVGMMYCATACLAVAIQCGAAQDQFGKVREVRTDHEVGLRNGCVSALFSGETGALVSLKNLVTGDDILKGPGGGGNPFRVCVNATEPPATLTLAYPYPVQPVEGAMGGIVVDPTDCSLASSSFSETDPGGSLSLVLNHRATALRFEMEIALKNDDVALEIRMTVQNEGGLDQKVRMALPHLTGLGLGGNRETNLGVRLREFGQSRAPAWSNQGGVYGRDWAGQWNAVYEPSLDEGLGVIVQDPEARNKIIRRFTPAGMSVLYFEDVLLEPGQTAQYPPALILVHSGDWKVTARRYASWFQSAFALRNPPQWVDDVDLFVGAWIPAPATVEEAKKGLMASGGIASYEDLSRITLNDPYDLKEWAQYWQCVVDTGRYDAYDHTDGVYDIRRDLGGASALMKGVSKVERLGRHVGLYVASKTVRKDSRLFLGRRMEDWLLMDIPDKTIPSEALSFWACGGYEPWQDHLADTCRRLLRETKASYIRLDEMGHPFEPCHNPAHHHPSPYGAMQWNLELLRKVRAAMDEVNPQALLFTEGAFELLHQVTDGALCLWSPGTDIAPLRLTAPDYLCFSYHSGQIESAINGFVCGTIRACNGGGWFTEHHNQIWGAGLEKMPPCYGQANPNGLPETEMQWHLLSHTFIEAARRGDPTDANPVLVSQDPEDWVGRLWRSPTYWLLVAGNRAGLTPPSPIQVKLPDLPEAVAGAFEFDASTLKGRSTTLERSLQGGASVTISSGFSAVFLPLPACLPMVVVDDPLPVLRPGETLEIALRVFSPWRTQATRVQGRVSAPGLKPNRKSIRLPCRLRLQAPESVEPGLYPLNIEGHCLPLKRWLRVEG